MRLEVFIYCRVRMRFPGLLDGEPEDWAEYGEHIIGRAVLKQLSVPATVAEAIEALWYGFRATPPGSLGDTLLLANELSPVPSPLHRLPPRSCQTIRFLD